MRAWAKAVAICAVLFGAASCGSTNDHSACNAVCVVKGQCVANYDVTNCTNQCSADIDNSDAYANQISLCGNCLKGRTCDQVASCLGICPNLP